MSLTKFTNVKISGISVVVPENEINIYDEAQYYDHSVKKIDRMRKIVGFWKRRVATKGQTALDYAYNAALSLINEMRIDVSTIDGLIYVVQKPDWIGPVNAYFLHHKLGLSTECIATDVVQGCAGWVFGLYLASQMIESGSHKKILLLNGDIPSVGIDPSDRNQAPIFGDAGSATLVEYTEKDQTSYFNIDTISEGYDAIINPFSGCRFGMDLLNDRDFEKFSQLRNEKVALSTGNYQPLLGSYLDGLKVFDFTLKQVPKTIKELMSYTNKSLEDISLLALHQANKQIVQSLGTESGFALEKVPYEAFETYGNNTMCSIPTVLSMLDKDINKENICCCGFGNGLIAAAAILNLSETHLGEIKIFKTPEYVKFQDEYIDFWRKKMQGQALKM